MMRSMTAFAAADQESADWRAAWEIRSVNHRYLDLSLRLPDAFRYLEPEIRGRVAGAFKRGRVDLSLTLKQTGQGEAEIRLHRDLVARLLGAAAEVESLSPRPLAGYSALDILRWPGVLHEPESDQETLATQILEVLERALERAVAARETEGGQLVVLIGERCHKLKEGVAAARLRMPEVLAAMRQKVLARIAEVTAHPDSDRLEQELVYLAQKLDVAEELDRLDTHVEEVLRSMRHREPAGRRLDFLLQEMNREANTLGSKSADAETTRISVEMKVLIEQMREQVQNIE